jgi:hypothetical protein
MAVPTSKSIFKDYCFRALGSGVKKVASGYRETDI